MFQQVLDIAGPITPASKLQRLFLALVALAAVGQQLLSLFEVFLVEPRLSRRLFVVEGGVPLPQRLRLGKFTTVQRDQLVQVARFDKARIVHAVVARVVSHGPAFVVEEGLDRSRVFQLDIATNPQGQAVEEGRDALAASAALSNNTHAGRSSSSQGM